jgi:hypothetical protein
MRPPTVAAVILPLLVLLGATAWLSTEPARELSAEAQTNDLALAKASPGIVIVGNSKSASDIDRAALAKGLGYEQAVANVRVGGSSAPAWYAMLEQRVFGGGYTPELVVVYGQLAAMLRVEADSAAERKGMEGQLSTPSAVLDAKVLGRGAGPFGRFAASARRNASAAHDALLAGVRDAAVGALLAPPGGDGLLAAGRSVSEPALEATFGRTARFRAGGEARVVPVAETRVSHAMTASEGAPEDSLVPDLITLAEAHGARVLFVRAPLPMSSRYMDTLAPELEKGVFDLMNRRGVSYIDLQDVPLPADAWNDHLHLSGSGRRAATDALVAAMAAANILEGGVAPARPVLLPTAVLRVGAPPALPPLTFAPSPNRACGFQAPLPDLAFLSNDALLAAGFGRSSPLVLADAAGPLTPGSLDRALGDTCAGAWQHRRFGAFVAPRAAAAEGLTLGLAEPTSVVTDAKRGPVWWVYPGTATEWRYDAPPGEATVEVEVTARAVHGGGARLRVAGVEVPLEPRGRVLHATATVPAPTGAWALAVAADADTWLVVDELVLDGQRLLGAPPVSLAPLIRAAVAPPDPPTVPAATVGTRDALTTLDVPDYAHLADDVLRARLDYPCSPLQLAAERAPDVWVKDAHLLATMLANGRPGYGHLGGTLLLSAPGDRMPEGPYRLRLDPRRKCGTSRWVYPGDTLTWDVVASTDRLRLGADRLVLTGIALLPADDPRPGASIHVRVAATQGATPPVAEGDLVLPATGGAARVCLPFATPFPPGTPMDLTLSASDAFVVTQLSIGESEHLAGCDQ